MKTITIPANNITIMRTAKKAASKKAVPRRKRLTTEEISQLTQPKVIYQRLTQSRESAEEAMEWGAALPPAGQKMLLESIAQLPEAQLQKVWQSVGRLPCGRIVRHVQRKEEYESNPQMMEIMMTFWRICTKVDEKTANVLDVIRSEYLQFNGLEPTNEEGHYWPLSKSAQSLFSSAKVDHAFRLRAERYIRLIYKCVQPTAATPLIPTGPARPS
jgi:hypothetical protein